MIGRQALFKLPVTCFLQRNKTLQFLMSIVYKINMSFIIIFIFLFIAERIFSVLTNNFDGHGLCIVVFPILVRSLTKIVCLVQSCHFYGTVQLCILFKIYKYYLISSLYYIIN